MERRGECEAFTTRLKQWVGYPSLLHPLKTKEKRRGERREERRGGIYIHSFELQKCVIAHGSP